MKATLTIKNFRSLRNVTLNLKLNTFLFGPNGSGKSSIWKALNFFNNNVIELNQFDNKTTFYLQANTNPGTYKDIVYKNELKRNIEYKYTYQSNFKEFWYLDSGIEFEDFIESIEKSKGKKEQNVGRAEYFNNLFKSSDLNERLEYLTYKSMREEFINEHFSIIDFDIQTCFKNTTDHRYLKKLIIKDNDSKCFIEYRKGDEEIKDKLDRPGVLKKVSLFNDEKLNRLFSEFRYKNDYKWILNRYIKGSKIIKEMGEELLKFIHEKLDTNKEWTNYDEQEKCNIFTVGLVQLFRFYFIFPRIIERYLGIYHITPIRSDAEKFYDINTREFDNLSQYNLLESFPTLDIASKMIDYIDKNEVDWESLRRDVYSFYWISIFNKLYEMKLAKGLYKIETEDIRKFMVINMNGTYSNLSDISSGLTQILPIIFNSQTSLGMNPLTKYNDNPNYTVFVEQPELHLHPKLQADLANYLISYDYKYIAPNFIIETHSEHIIRKIQVLVAKGEIEKEKIAVYYFNIDSGETKAKEMELLDNGFFKEPWPDGFFDDSYNLTKELLMAGKD